MCRPAGGLRRRVPPSGPTIHSRAIAHFGVTVSTLLFVIPFALAVWFAGYATSLLGRGFAIDDDTGVIRTINGNIVVPDAGYARAVTLL